MGRRDMKVGFCIGVWDGMHHGHVRLIDRALTQCDYLVVAVVKDAAVKAQKGQNRPLNPFEHRINMVTRMLGKRLYNHAMKDVGRAISSEGFNPFQAVIDYNSKAANPINIFFKGEDQYHISTEWTKDYGIEIIALDRTPGVSTTKNIEKANA
jgi:cytidyltransferase-like protein